MQSVFVVDTNQVSQEPIHPAAARRLLSAGEAAVWRTHPFTLILKRAVLPQAEPATPLRLKIDPGSKVTGMAIVNDDTGEVVWAAELTHRGQRIKDALASRRAVRRSRRQRKTRYRQPRFQNRRRRAGWLPPSLQSRVDNILTWVQRLARLCPLGAISQELVRFDTQALQHPEISGVQYQQGELFGYEVREYLLVKWGRRCAYCNVQNVPLQIDHIQARARGGTNRVSNLTLACEACNQAKGNQEVHLFLSHDPVRFERVQAYAKTPLKDAAAVNSTRWALFHCLTVLGLPVEVGTGGRTKYNRRLRGIEKSHWADATCVGASTPPYLWAHKTCLRPLLITATGRGSRQMCVMDKYGFPRTKPKQAKRVFGFQTGDIVQVLVPSGSKAGRYRGRVAVRATGNFAIKTSPHLPPVDGIAYRYCRLIQRIDGYLYT